MVDVFMMIRLSWTTASYPVLFMSLIVYSTECMAVCYIIQSTVWQNATLGNQLYDNVSLDNQLYDIMFHLGKSTV